MSDLELKQGVSDVVAGVPAAAAARSVDGGVFSSLTEAEVTRRVLDARAHGLDSVVAREVLAPEAIAP